ncbi:MAG: beta-galactosidase, partial [Chloroflexota bacterium]
DAEGRLVHPMLVEPPALALWRAPTDNDLLGGLADRWDAWGVARLRRRLEAIEHGSDAVTVRATWTTDAGIVIPHLQRLSRDADGRIHVDEEVEIPAVLDDLPRVGTVLEVVPGCRDLEGLGRGPHEPYPDRARGGRIGRWRERIADQLVPYVGPQECGGHAETRRLRLIGETGSLTIRLERPMQVSALHLRAADLAAAAHQVELRPRAETIIHLDAAHRGLGTLACGPDTLARYVLRPGTYRWSWALGHEPAGH